MQDWKTEYGVWIYKMKITIETKSLTAPFLLKLCSHQKGKVEGGKKGIKEKITNSYQILPVTLGPVAIYSQV